MNTPYVLTRFEGVTRIPKYRQGQPITDINRICQLIDEQRQNGGHIFLRDKLKHVSVIDMMSFGTVRSLLKGRAFSEAIKNEG